MLLHNQQPSIKIIHQLVSCLYGTNMPSGIELMMKLEVRQILVEQALLWLFHQQVVAADW